ncbi:MAG TPA: hypothetical protein VGN88_01990 [Phycisphaerae bacterium]
MAFDPIGIILHVIVAAVCASTYWKAAAMEDNGPSPFLWMGASLAVFMVTWLVLDWRWSDLIFAQVGMGLAIGIVRAVAYLRKNPQ